MRLPGQPRGLAARGLVAVLLLVVGVVLGVASTLVHQGHLGLVVAVAAPAATVYALPGGWWARFAFTAGWLAAVVYFLQTRPEGDFVISADARGYTLLGAALVFMVFSVATLRPLRPVAAGADPPAPLPPGGDGIS